MAKFREYDRVRVHHLSGTPEAHLASSGSARPPQIGDVGTIVSFRNSDDGSQRVIVETVTDTGETIWLAEFTEDELRPASSTE